MSGRKRHASSSESGSGSSSSSSDSESSEGEVGPQIPDSVEKDSHKQDSENNEKSSRKVKKRKNNTSVIDRSVRYVLKVLLLLPSKFIIGFGKQVLSSNTKFFVCSKH